ncbi:hypothetical protein KY363_01615 [Candidatus Woesearchaeota archaeon]|nr:hypothetical protein [Candidatus Woesearchaeota archaeon]
MYRTNAQLWTTEESRTEIKETLEGRLEWVTPVEVLRDGNTGTVMNLRIRNKTGAAEALFPMTIPHHEYDQLLGSNVRYVCARSSRQAASSRHMLTVLDGEKQGLTYACGLNSVLIIPPKQ